MIDLWTLLGVIWVVFLWDFYLSIRQYRVHRNTEKRPEDVKGIISEEEYRKARLYRIDKHEFGFVRSICAQLQNTAMLACGIYVLLWSLCGSINQKIGIPGEMSQSMTFIVVTTLIETVLNLPWQMYDTFVTEEKHGFNKQTMGFFMKDTVKKTVVNLLLVLPITAIVIYIVEHGGPYFFFYIWIFLSVVLFLLMAIYPEFIAPLFDVYTPLPESPLREKIENLAKKCSFPLKKLYVVHGSKRSAHSNAYMYGFWNNKRIVLYDTLLSDELNAKLRELSDSKSEEESKDEDKSKQLGLADDEVVAVLGHELGHWEYLHTVFNIFITEVYLLGMLFMFHVCYNDPSLFDAFGFHTSKPTIIAFIIVFHYVMSPYDELVQFLMTIMSRRMEFSADRFSWGLGQGEQLCAALVKLGKSNLSLPVDDYLYSMFNHSHPPIPQRIAAIRDKKNI